jgi:hypothetical protein
LGEKFLWNGIGMEEGTALQQRCGLRGGGMDALYAERQGGGDRVRMPGHYLTPSLE